jgi:hypothetical protein
MNRTSAYNLHNPPEYWQQSGWQQQRQTQTLTAEGRPPTAGTVETPTTVLTLAGTPNSNSIIANNS